MVSCVNGLSSNAVVLGGPCPPAWWLVVVEDGPSRVVAGPFADRVEADWACAPHGPHQGTTAVFGVRRADGSLGSRPSPEDEIWLVHLAEQLDGLPVVWDADLAEDDPLITLAVEVAAALAESGLPLLDSSGSDGLLGGACLAPETWLGGIVVAWRQHDRMSIDQVHGAEVDDSVQRVMNRALADVLELRGFTVEAFAGAHVVRSSSPCRR